MSGMNPLPLIIKQMEIGPMQNYVYLIGDRDAGVAAVVDPGWEPQTILDAAAKVGLKLTHIFITHTHFDHINAVEEVLKKTDAQVCVHKDEAPFLKFAKKNILRTEAGQKVKVGNMEIEFLHTPGHSPGSQCFLVQGNLISGDTLFINACGRTDLPGGDPQQLYHSLHDCLAKLPPGTILFPGHNYAQRPTSTIGDEKKENPYLAAQSLDQFLLFHTKMI